MSKATNVNESEIFEGEVVSEGEGANAVSVIRGAKLLGLRSKNRRNYDTPGVRSAAKSLLEGARVNIDHPSEPDQPRSYRDAFGVVEGYEYRPGAGHFGNIRFNPEHPLAKQFAWDVKNNPNGLGMSINARIVPGKTDKNGDIVVESLLQVRSVDIVTKPGTANGIFESDSSGDDEIMDLKTLREKHPELLEELKKESQESQEAETLRAQLKAASDALEALKAEETARKLKDTVMADFTEILKESAFDADLQKEIVECACQLQEESRKKYRTVIEKMAKAAPMLEEVGDEDLDDNSVDEDDDKEVASQTEEEDERKADVKKVGRRPGRHAAGSGKTQSLRSMLGIGKK